MNNKVMPETSPNSPTIWPEEAAEKEWINNFLDSELGLQDLDDDTAEEPGWTWYLFCPDNGWEETSAEAISSIMSDYEELGDNVGDELLLVRFAKTGSLENCDSDGNPN